MKGLALHFALLFPAFAGTSRRPSPRISELRGVLNSDERLLLGLHQDGLKFAVRMTSSIKEGMVSEIL